MGAAPCSAGWSTNGNCSLPATSVCNWYVLLLGPLGDDLPMDGCVLLW